MKETELQKLVDDAVALHRDIAAKTERLKAIKGTLVQQARLHPKDLTLTETGGKRWTVKGSEGCIARVSFPAPALVSEIEGQSDLAKQLQALAGEAFRRLFPIVKIYHLAENFRAEAKAQLTASKAEALIALCETNSAPRVGFEAASPAPAPELA